MKKSGGTRPPKSKRSAPGAGLGTVVKRSNHPVPNFDHPILTPSGCVFFLSGRRRGW